MTTNTNTNTETFRTVHSDEMTRWKTLESLGQHYQGLGRIDYLLELNAVIRSYRDTLSRRIELLESLAKEFAPLHLIPNLNDLRAIALAYRTVLDDVSKFYVMTDEEYDGLDG